MEIKQEKIARITNYLNDLRILTNRGNGQLPNSDKQKIHQKYSLPFSVFMVAREMGYFTKIGNQKYIVGKVQFEPIHARKLAEKHLEHYRAQQNEYKKNKVEKPQFVEIKETKKDPKPLKEVSVKNVIVQPKTFSILWGLIKFNY
jgi:hypothetical protein